MNKVTTSKKILWVSYAVVIILTIIVCICTFISVDCSNLVIVCGASWTELGAHTIFYSKKAQKENSIKIAYGMIDKLANKYGIENVVSLFETINRD